MRQPEPRLMLVSPTQKHLLKRVFKDSAVKEYRGCCHSNQGNQITFELASQPGSINYMTLICRMGDVRMSIIENAPWFQRAMEVGQRVVVPEKRIM